MIASSPATRRIGCVAWVALPLLCLGCRAARHWPEPHLAVPRGVPCSCNCPPRESGWAFPPQQSELPAASSMAFARGRGFPPQQCGKQVSETGNITLLTWRPPKQPGNDPLEEAERAYQLAWEAELHASPEAVELAHGALVAASRAWLGPHFDPGTEPSRARALHDSSLSLLLRTAQRHGRWNPRLGIQLLLPDGPRTIPVRYRDFTWSSSDFQELELVGDYPTEGLNHVHRRHGAGVPLVAIRRRESEERFFDAVQPFAATAVWQPASASLPPLEQADAGGRMELGAAGTLEIHNPLYRRTVTVGHETYPLAADLSAPFAWALLREPRRFREGFFRPGQPGEQAKLFMLEPHRTGRMPVVFVHGLFSDPFTWIAAANDLAAQPWFAERYEVWGFRYPTGEPFLRSAATLREELRVLHDHLDGLRPDPALDRMVLIGHSMGGLVCKLQVTSSGERLWQSASYRDFTEIRAAPERRAELARLFFFEPQPFVERTVFIGTPHGGSAWAGRLVGRVASSLVEPTRQQVASHCRLMQDNPGAFAPYIRSRVPTSVDLLEPRNPLLQAIRQLPVSPRVRLHSVIGTGGLNPLGHPSDGVVPVQSARHPGVVDELYVDERHEDLQRHPKTIHFLDDLLRTHAAQAPDST